MFAAPDSRATAGNLAGTLSSDVTGSNLSHFCRTRASPYWILKSLLCSWVRKLVTVVTISEEAELNTYKIKKAGCKFSQIQIVFPFNHLFIETHLCPGLSMKSTSNEYFRQNW